MRHGKKINHLGRTDSHRKAMLANMASSLIKHKRISTTLAKAKALRTYVEPIITKSKTDTTHSRRIVFGYLQDKETVTELFRDIAAKVANRPGGYTRIIKLNNRLGDNAEMALIELVDYNEVYGSEAASAEKKSTRRGRSKAKKSDAPAAKAEKVAEAKVEEIAEETPAKEEAAPEAPAAETKEDTGE
jgi:large subunit ribosomal protein L17